LQAFLVSSKNTIDNQNKKNMKRFLTAVLALTLASGAAKAQQPENPGLAAAGNNGISIQTHVVPLSTTSLLAMANNPAGPEYDRYKKRARTHRTIGLSLLGAGVVLGVTGILVASADDGDANTGFGERNDDAAATLFLFSAGTGIASIPFMILASANSRKAKALLKNEQAYLPGRGTVPVTGVTVAIQIGK